MYKVADKDKNRSYHCKKVKEVRLYSSVFTYIMIVVGGHKSLCILAPGTITQYPTSNDVVIK